MENGDIRAKIVSAGLRNFEVAEMCHCTDSTFSRWLRRQLAPDDPRRVLIERVLDEELERRRRGVLRRRRGELQIKIKYHEKDLNRIEKISVGDWYDLRAAEDSHIRQGEMAYISLGVSMELPEGYEAIVAPRSSTPKKFGVICANSFGVIDNSYCGDGDVWKFPAYAIRDTKIWKNDRICQFRIQKNQPDVEFIEVETLGNDNRGGFGSTG